MATEAVGEGVRPAGEATVSASQQRHRIPGQPGRYARYEGLLIGTASVAIFLVVWQGIAFARVVPELFLPGPTDIWGAFAGLVREGKIWNDLWVSGQELFFGYTLAIIVAIPLGLIMGWYRRLNYALDPFVSFFYSTPRIALLPLFIIWFGIGINSKIAVIFLGSFFPILINTVAGVRIVDAGLIKTALSFSASDIQIFRTIILPGSVPFILTGLRLGVGHALIGVVVGELIAAQAGIGLMMANAGATYQTSRVFAGVFILAFSGLTLTYALQRIERRFQAWRPTR